MLSTEPRGGHARREFLGVLSGAGVAWPVMAWGQQAAMPVIGSLSARSADEAPYLVAAFHRGLAEIGYAEGKNVALEYTLLARADEVIE